MRQMQLSVGNEALNVPAKTEVLLDQNAIRRAHHMHQVASYLNQLTDNTRSTIDQLHKADTESDYTLFKRLLVGSTVILYLFANAQQASPSPVEGTLILGLNLFALGKLVKDEYEQSLKPLHERERRAMTPQESALRLFLEIVNEECKNFGVSFREISSLPEEQKRQLAFNVQEKVGYKTIELLKKREALVLTAE